MRGPLLISTLVGASALGACSFTPGTLPSGSDSIDAPGTTSAEDAAIDAAPDGPPGPFHVRLEAYIDGKSNLILKGNTAQWHHLEFAAPGRESFVNYPTRFDGVDWFPVWPDVPNAENRYCNCTSNVYSALTSSIPRVPSTVRWMSVDSRRTPSIVQVPTAANDYTFIFQISDVGEGGSYWYVFDLYATPL